MQNMDVIILCGGKGTRLSEETSSRPKPMVEIGDKPILWHIMKYYSYFGFKRFILALGYKGDYIKEYFFNLRITNNNFTLDFNSQEKPIIHDSISDDDFEITFIDTGLNTLKGGRIKRVEQFVRSQKFHLTYGDGLSNVDLKRLVEFHNNHGQIGTVTAVRPPSRFGNIYIKDNQVVDFEEKSQMNVGYINGGFFIFDRRLFNYLESNQDCDFEFGPLEKIAQENQLMAYKHNDFWQCMDNIRERDYLRKLEETNKAPWIKWR